METTVEGIRTKQIVFKVIPCE